MKNFFDWISERPELIKAQWIILGKGPTFSCANPELLKPYRTMALNHVVRAINVDIAHAIDVEVIEQCEDNIFDNAGVLVMPWVPHERFHKYLGLKKKTRFRPSTITLEEYCEQIPILELLNRAGRLLWYNLCTAPKAQVQNGYPVIQAYGFSATAALNLLALASIKRIRSLGIDGGKGYSRQFFDLNKKTMLVAGQSSYNLQFEEMARTIMKTKVDFSPLDVQAPIQIFVGTLPEQMLAVKVLEYSITKHASMTVEVTPLYKAVEDAGIIIPELRDPNKKPRTPFSFQRFAIPQICNYKGRAIYLDSDMLVFKDIRHLWLWPFGGAELLSVKEKKDSDRASQFSVMVLDCNSLNWKVEEIIQDLQIGKWTYEELLYEMALAKKVGTVLPPEWNELERYRYMNTALLHYTDMANQPWLSTNNKLARIWCNELFGAIDEGYLSVEYVKEQIDLGWVRPSLLFQIKERIPDPLLLSAAILKQDKMYFVPPPYHRQALKQFTRYGRKSTATSRLTRRVYATARHVAIESGTDKLMKKMKRKLFKQRWS